MKLWPRVVCLVFLTHGVYLVCSECVCCCSRATRNASFFAEVEQAFALLPNHQVSVGGNAPVMAQRFISEGIEHVMLGASMAAELRSQVDPRVKGHCCRGYSRYINTFCRCS